MTDNKFVYFFKTLYRVIKSNYFVIGLLLFLFITVLLFDDLILRITFSAILVSVVFTVVLYNQKRIFKLKINNLINKNEKLEKGTEYYNSFMDSILDWIWEIDAKGNITYSNNAINLLLGFDSEDIVGRSIFNFLVPINNSKDDYFSKKHNMFFKKFSKNLEEGEILENIRLNYKHKSKGFVATEGMVVPIYSSSIPKTRKILGFRGTVRDISSQLILETTLINNEKRFKDLTDQLPQTILEINTKGSISFMNATGYKIFGYTNNNILKIGDLVFENDKSRLNKLLETIMNKGGKNVYGVFIALKNNGKHFPINLYGSPIYIDNNISGARCILVDITAQKETENKLKDSLLQVDQAQKKILALERKNTVEAMGITANHEINQPLQVLKSSLHIFEKSMDSNTISRAVIIKFVGKMKKSTLNIQKILDSYKGDNAVGFGDYTKEIKMMMFENKKDEKKNL